MIDNPCIAIGCAQNENEKLNLTSLALVARSRRARAFGPANDVIVNHAVFHEDPPSAESSL